MQRIATTPELEALITADPAVIGGISGGKDSVTLAFDMFAWLDSVGHKGPRALVHSDLGRVEWRSSLPDCRALAEHLAVPLIVVKRQRGDLMDRWADRWRANLARYAALDCVKLILPWSTPSMRFCTSELKTAIICRGLIERFPGQVIINAAGLRAEESPARAKKPIFAENAKLSSKRAGTRGYDWLPILGYSISDVWATHERNGWPPAAPYALGMSRVSCAFCILATRADLLTASTDPENHEIYREMCDLESLSAFSFQDRQWLGDVAPHLLSEAQRYKLDRAKKIAQAREYAQAAIPAHLLYTRQGWPAYMPTDSEAQTIADVRHEIACLYGLRVEHTTAGGVLGKFEALIEAAGRVPQVYAGA